MPLPPSGTRKNPNPYPFDPNLKSGRPAKYPFFKTQIGEAFPVRKAATRRSSLQQLCYLYGKDLGRRFIIEDDGENFRVVCVAPQELITVTEPVVPRVQVGETLEFPLSRGAVVSVGLRDRFSAAITDNKIIFTRTK